MEFSVSAFAHRLMELIASSEYFPYMKDEALNEKKHKGRLLHIKDVAFRMNGVQMPNENTAILTLGNDYAEKYYPYYHILEDAPYIRKSGKATAKTRGSQAKVEKLSERDYNRVTWNGKTFTKEYSRNVRGARNRTNNVSRWVADENGEVKFINREANSYLNIHYHYIEKILESGILDQIASEFGLTRKKRVKNLGLKDDYDYQEGASIVDIMRSHFK